MATGQTDIYTAKMGQPPMPDEGPTISAKPKKKAGQAEIYTEELGNPPIDYEGPTKNIKKPRKMAGGGSASSRADGCCQRGKTKGRML
jgi:hypothetical protein